jgi:hypothetical protein
VIDAVEEYDVRVVAHQLVDEYFLARSRAVQHDLESKLLACLSLFAQPVRIEEDNKTLGVGTNKFSVYLIITFIIKIFTQPVSISSTS